MREGASGSVVSCDAYRVELHVGEGIEEPVAKPCLTAVSLEALNPIVPRLVDRKAPDNQ